MGYDLRRGLDDMGARAALPGTPVEPDDVVAQVRRRRALRTTTVVSVAAAAALVTAVVVQAAPWQGPPLPPADPTPSVTTPTPTPSPTSTTAPRPEATETIAPPTTTDVEPAVALTDQGDVVLLDPVSGEVTETVAAGVLPAGTPARLSLSPDDRAVYVGRPSADPQGWGEVVRVSLEDGSVEPVASGYDPDLSADGRTLVYVAVEAGEAGDRRSIAFLDLVTGDVRRVPDEECTACERVVQAPTWTADGSGVLVVSGWFDTPYDVQVTELVLDDLPDALQAGRVVGPPAGEPVGWVEVVSRSDGKLVVAGSRESGDGSEERFLAVVDPETGTTSTSVAAPDGGLRSVTPDEAGDVVLAVTTERVGDGPRPTYRGTLLRWDVASGEVVTVRDGVLAVAR